MYNFNLDKFINELFRLDLENPFLKNFPEFPELFGEDKGKWTKKTYTSKNGLVSCYVYSTKTDKESNPTDYTIELKNDLEKAVNEQDFETAVVLRDKIKNLESNLEKIKKLEDELSESVKTQNFEKSIELRDKINKLKSK